MNKFVLIHVDRFNPTLYDCYDLYERLNIATSIYHSHFTGSKLISLESESED